MQHPHKPLHASQQEECMSPSNDKVQEINELLKFLKEQGAEWESVSYPVYFKNSYNGYYPGVITTEDIPKHKIVISIPYHVNITSYKGYHSELNEFYKANDALYKNSTEYELHIMVAFIVYQLSLGEKSLWYLMFKQWPKSANLLMFYSDEQLSLLEDTGIKKRQIELRNKIVSEFALFKEAALMYPQYFNSDCVKWETYKYAYENLVSRLFVNNEQNYCISPLAEFVNHQNVSSYYTNTVCIKKYEDSYDELDDNSPLYNIDSEQETPTKTYLEFINTAEDFTRTLNIETGRTQYKKGEQLYIQYCKQSNIHFLQNYGFLNEYNKYDAYMLPVTDIFTSSKIASFYGMTITSNYCIQLISSVMPLKLLTASKIVLSCYHIKESPQYSYTNACDEVDALEYSIALITKQFGKYSTSVDDDIKLLKQTNSNNEFFAILYRKEQKRILHEQISMLHMAIIYNKLFKNNRATEIIDESVNQMHITIEQAKATFKTLQHYIQFIK